MWVKRGQRTLDKCNECMCVLQQESSTGLNLWPLQWGILWLCHAEKGILLSFFWPTYSFRGKIHCKSKQNSSGSPLSCDETSLSWWESLEHCTVQFGLSAFFLMYNFSPQSPKKHIQWFIFLVLLSCHQALHLLKEMDHDGDGQISESEVLKNQETFMNSEVTDYGRQLHVSTHDEL